MAVLANLFWNEHYVCLNSSLHLYKQTFDNAVFRCYLTLTLRQNQFFESSLTCFAVIFFFFKAMFVLPYFLFLFKSTLLNRVLCWVSAGFGLYTWPPWGSHLPLHLSPALLSRTPQHREWALLPRKPPPQMANCSWIKCNEEGFLCILPAVL